MMDKKMKALVSYAPYDNRLEEVDIPSIGPDELLVKVEGCGICAGDVKSYHGGIRIWGTHIENRYIEPPVIGGHEFCGEVVKAGEEMAAFTAGDRVVAEQIVPCGECGFCRQGKYWMCAQSAVYGFKQHIQGGFAEYIKLHKNSIIHKVPPTFTTEEAVLIEPIACGMHAVEQAGIRHEDVVVIAGLGAIGTSMVNLAGLYMPKMVIGIDVKKHRLEMGKKYGADYVLDPAGCNVPEEIKRLTGGYGCDVYIEASGSPASVGQGLDSLKNHGRYVQMGVFADEVKADWNMIGDGKELSIRGSHLSALTFESVIGGIQKGLVRTEGLISHSFPLEKWQEAFEASIKEPQAMKIMLRP
ncbi:alcohol dehydrogenase catalytic domain-containing protein [Luxibacter massiliensis]|uniref:alcohol dehydrogenase catalytic domain-containing protein n=1 Tax=Luxibacter massiliensis TaxID=2219695 RepID=UPI000F04A36B|nr:alcohol dehydrogenase catalytic domain-containing protein [Luxibacter massiliensis]